MAKSESLLTSPNQSPLATAASAVVPGLGQLLLGHVWRGVLIFIITAISAFLVNWGLDNGSIGAVTLGSLETSWLWLPFILFWAWNAWDAYSLSKGHPAPILLAVLFAAIILYVIAWEVTNVRLDRLITRAGDARKILTDLANPELAAYDVNGEEAVCSWACLYDFATAKWSGRTPEHDVKWSSNVLDIFGEVKAQRAPKWMVNLGMAETGQNVRMYVAGKMVETIAIGLMATIFSTILAIPVSFLAAHNVMSRFRGGSILYYIMRLILNVVRAVDTVVWGLIVIVWVGLGTFAGVIALTIHSVAALAKLYSEEIEHIDTGPVEATTATGSNLLQTIRYAIIPQIVPPFLAYTLLRWDINMRSATVIGFVAGGGIGFFVIETIRMGGYQQYATALWVVAVVIILVDWISARWRERILEDRPVASQPKYPTLSRLGKIFYAVLLVALFAYFWNVTEISLKAMFEPAPTFLRLIKDFIKIDVTQDVLNLVIKQILITIFQALLATTLGALIALPFSFLAAKNLAGKNPGLVLLYTATRAVFNVLRSIEALLYVAIFIFWVGIGPFAGMLALAITTFALIGKLFSEAIENIDPGPIEALNATGSNRLQMINYAILPQIVPPFVSYLIYQWDINIRMATIIGFAGGGGIGLTLSTYFGSLQYHKAGTVVLFIVIVVALMDFTSAKIREVLV